MGREMKTRRNETHGLEMKWNDVKQPAAKLNKNEVK